MDKSSSQIGVNPLTKINSLTAVASIGSPAQSLDSRADHLAKQHAGLHAQKKAPGLGLSPKIMTSIADVSATAKLINQSLKQADANGISHKYIAQSVITNHPKLPDVVSQQLRAAISNSGLFYESHLSALVEGRRQLASIKQEPQNQFNQLSQSLLPQQLHILEHQRLSWYGEVWPNQLMDWDIYLKNSSEYSESNRALDEPDEAIASDLTLHLPHLGKVTAKISIKNGKMHIGLLAEQKEALQLIKDKSPSLVSAIESNGQKLEGLTLDAFDREKTR